MIRCHLSTLMGRAKMNIADVQRATGLNRTTITSLYYETTQRIELPAVAKLCELFSCSVGELLEYVAESESQENLVR